MTERAVYEKPGLEFGEYAIALHFVARTEAIPRERRNRSRSDINFKSFEDDILSYSFRRAPPFTSEVVDVDAPLTNLLLEFPQTISYEAEGANVTLHRADRPGGDQGRNVQIRASRSDFSSGVSVLHLVFMPGGPDGSLNEYDIVKLIKLWEHGELWKDGKAVSMAELITLRSRDPARAELSLSQLAEAVFRLDTSASPGEDEPRTPRLGSIQLVDVKEWEAIADSIRSLDEASTQELSLQVIGVGGIVQGLLDFAEIGVGELMDVFDLVDVGRRGMSGIHKGTVVSIAKSDRVYRQTKDTLGATPYLLLPQAVLLHNEWLLGSAQRAAEEASAAVKEPRKSLVRTLVDAEHEMRRALDVDYLPNVFHYSAERSLYTEGTRSRALRDRRRKLQGQLAEVNGWWREAIADRQKSADNWRNLLLTLIAAIGLAAAIYPVLEDFHVGVWVRVAVSLTIALLVSGLYAWLQWRQRAEDSRSAMRGRIRRVFRKTSGS